MHQIPLFANLPEQEIDSLMDTLREIHCEAGEVLFQEGSASETIYIVLDGEVQIVKSLGTTDERILGLSTAGAILGEMRIFRQDGGHTASARAHTPLRLMAITPQQFDAMLREHHELAYNLLRLYSQRLHESENTTIADLREKNRQLTKAYQELQAAQAAMIEKEKLEHEVNLAAEIQRGVLPEHMPSYPGFHFGALIVPARQVGGDFYDLIRLDDRHVGVVVGDVCDKGMPAAMFMALTYSSIRTEALRMDSPGDTLQAVNRHLMQINRSMMYVTLLYGVLDLQTRQFRYARAGHTEPLLLDDTNQPVKVPFGLGQPLGLFDYPTVDEQCITISDGGTLLLYSDGLSETVESSDDAPRLPEFCSALLQKKALDAQGLCDALWRAAEGSSEAPLIQDDFTVVAVQARSSGAASG